jgi:hypothetical protein
MASGKSVRHGRNTRIVLEVARALHALVCSQHPGGCCTGAVFAPGGEIVVADSARTARLVALMAGHAFIFAKTMDLFLAMPPIGSSVGSVFALSFVGLGSAYLALWFPKTGGGHILENNLKY